MEIDKERFGEVWQRVTAANNTAVMPDTVILPDATMRPDKEANSAEADINELQKFIDGAASRSRYCRKIASRCQGRTGRALYAIADSECRHLKKLRVQLFLLTGDTYCPTEQQPPVITVSEALRGVYKSETKAAMEYLAAAETAPSDLAKTYRELACDEKRHAEAVERLLECMIC